MFLLVLWCLKLLWPLASVENRKKTFEEFGSIWVQILGSSACDMWPGASHVAPEGVSPVVKLGNNNNFYFVELQNSIWCSLISIHFSCWYCSNVVHMLSIHVCYIMACINTHTHVHTPFIWCLPTSYHKKKSTSFLSLYISCGTWKEKCPTQLQAFEHLVPSWWHCLDRS